VLSGGEIPFVCFADVLRNALAVFIEGSEIIFRGRVVNAGGNFVILEGEAVILCNELSVFVEVAEIERGTGIVLGDGDAEPFKGGLNVVRRRIVGEKGFCKAELRAGVAALGQRLEVGRGGGGESLPRLRSGEGGWNRRERCEEKTA
jgi:hypothetical protein